jgi:serine/threonine-protein kinase HipA
VAEGWLRNAQARALKIDPSNRFALLLAFGHDCAGAVSVLDPAPIAEPAINPGDPTTAAALASRASLSGIQPKLLVVKDGTQFRPARRTETSTHIAKLASGSLNDIIENEYITTVASRALLPDDSLVDVNIGSIHGIDARALLIQRFDRRRSGTKLHFEEFNQLLGRRSGDDKYEASYEALGQFILGTPACAPADAWRLYRRILTCVLTGNTDAHLKNFAMFHQNLRLTLTPAYDLVAAGLYPEYQQLALTMGNAALRLTGIKPKHLATLGRAYGLSAPVITDTAHKLDQRRRAAEEAIAKASKDVGASALGQRLQDLMERRWNGSFASIGQFLSKKQSADDAS